MDSKPILSTELFSVSILAPSISVPPWNFHDRSTDFELPRLEITTQKSEQRSQIETDPMSSLWHYWAWNRVSLFVQEMIDLLSDWRSNSDQRGPNKQLSRMPLPGSFSFGDLTSVHGSRCESRFVMLPLSVAAVPTAINKLFLAFSRVVSKTINFEKFVQQMKIKKRIRLFSERDERFRPRFAHNSAQDPAHAESL